MTIERKKPWGEQTIAPHNLTICASDLAISESSLEKILALVGGDVWRALGQPGLVTPGQPCTRVAIDALAIKVTRSDHSSMSLQAASSVAVGRWWSRVGYSCVLNAGFLGNLNLAPRGHPNDGRIELFTIDAEVPLRQRVMMRRRARSGTHLPHPGASVQSASSFSIQRISRNQILTIDGVRIDDWVSCEVLVEPDHWKVVL